MAEGGRRIISQRLRATLKKPLGVLRESMVELAAENLVCVGDVVSESAIVSGLAPKIVVYDGRCKRKECGVSQAIEGYAAREVVVDNPAGGISGEAADAVRDALASSGKTKIRVRGEEDLLTLPAIAYAPEGWKVAYGQPDEGVVEVTVNANIKNKVKKMLEDMEDGL